MTLNDFLVSEIFTFLLIFCRVGTAITILPGFGETFISPRFRLLLAAMFSVVLTPVIQDFPAPPATVFALVALMSAEILTGIFIGTIGRLLLTAISVGVCPDPAVSVHFPPGGKANSQRKRLR